MDLPVFDEDGFHVLAADIQDEGDLGVESRGGAEVGQRLHHALVNAKGGADQVFAIAGHHAAGDVGQEAARLEGRADQAEAGLHRPDGIAAVAGIKIIDHFPLCIHQHHLGGGGARINAQEIITRLAVLDGEALDAVPGLRFAPGVQRLG